MSILQKEDQKTVKYQENLKIFVKNIDKKINTIWRPIYEVKNNPFLKKQTFCTICFRLILKHPNKPQFLPSDVKKN